MDNRHTKREDSRWEAILSYPGGLPVSGTVRNFSAGGMFIELPPHTIKRDTLVTVTAIVRERDTIRVERWSGQVMHRRLHGVGIQLRHPAADKRSPKPRVARPNPATATHTYSSNSAHRF